MWKLCNLSFCVLYAETETLWRIQRMLCRHSRRPPDRRNAEFIAPGGERIFYKHTRVRDTFQKHTQGTIKILITLNGQNPE